MEIIGKYVCKKCGDDIIGIDVLEEILEVARDGNIEELKKIEVWKNE